MLTAPSMEKLSALAAQLKGPCTVIEGSLGNEALPETLLYAALDRFGRCDICFNNGALYEAGIIETVDIERLTSMIRVNVEGSFRVAYVFLKHFVSEGCGAPGECIEHGGQQFAAYSVCGDAAGHRGAVGCAGGGTGGRRCAGVLHPAGAGEDGRTSSLGD